MREIRIFSNTYMKTPLKTISVLGVGVSAMSLSEAVDRLTTMIEDRHPGYICVTGAHGVIEAQDDPALLKIHNEAAMVTPDGMPVVWMCRWLGAPNVTRVYGPDLLLETCERLQSRDIRHYFYGGGPGIAERLSQRLVEKFPEMVVANVYCPPFRELSDDELIETCKRINASAADIVWVGLSSPKQEYWMARARAYLTAPVLVGIGAAFDFHSGEKRQAPRWMQRSGFEWLFRALTEPRRLGRRYLKTVPRFAFLAARQLLFERRKG